MKNKVILISIIIFFIISITATNVYAPVVGEPYRRDEDSSGGKAVGRLLGYVFKSVLQGINKSQQNKEDEAYRSSAAKLLGLPEGALAHFKRDEIKELLRNYNK